ncbi:hypothetical protein TNCV_4970531 [Trichonephila clavipes]|nr:hypothetical protein TNCV_4970531 [Trichonephila clavipes]
MGSKNIINVTLARSCQLHASQLKWTIYLAMAMAPRPLHQLCGQCDVEQWKGEELYRSPGRLHNHTRLSSVPKTNRDSSLNTTFANNCDIKH